MDDREREEAAQAGVTRAELAAARRQVAGRALVAHLGSVFLARLSLVIPYRIVYPFLPSIARGLGVSLPVATSLVSLRLASGLAAPVLGTAADRYSRQRVMEAALASACVAGVLLAGSKSPAAAAAAFLLYGLGKVLFDPALYAYLGDTVPYRRRGRIVGIVELSWSASWLLGVPAAGFLIARYGWQLPWAILAVLALLSLAAIHFGVSALRSVSALGGTRASFRSLVGTWSGLAKQPGIVALLLTHLLLMLALEIPFIVYGAWLEGSYHLSLTGLGMASMVLGVAEAAAEVTTALLTDRWGKRSSVLGGLACLTVALAALPGLAGLGLTAALAGLAVAVLAFEFSVVSLLPLTSEMAPGARATLLSFGLTASYAGRLLGSLIGGWLWAIHPMGIGLHSLLGSACALAAALILARGLSEIGTSEERRDDA